MNKPTTPEPKKNGAADNQAVPPHPNLASLAALLLPDGVIHSTTDAAEKDALMVAALKDAARLWVHAGRVHAEMLEGVNGFSYVPTSKRFYPDRRTDQLRQDLKRDFGIKYKSDRRNTAYKLKASLERWQGGSKKGKQLGTVFESWLRQREHLDEKTKEIYYLLSADDYHDYAVWITSQPEHSKNGRYSNIARAVLAYSDVLACHTART
jgi:hypothetical protein